MTMFKKGDAVRGIAVGINRTVEGYVTGVFEDEILINPSFGTVTAPVYKGCVGYVAKRSSVEYLQGNLNYWME